MINKQIKFFIFEKECRCIDEDPRVNRDKETTRIYRGANKKENI